MSEKCSECNRELRYISSNDDDDIRFFCRRCGKTVIRKGRTAENRNP